MDNNKFQIEVLQRLTAIEATLKQLDYKTILDKLNKDDVKIGNLENKTKSNEERLDKIEDNGRWLWRTVAGSILLALLGLVYKL